ncbi:MAG: type II toxin-antitoxin system prevent-host-death family antitoxin [Opitutaceae bacterium]|nr:type II toxin-antitoxin system prevent-host-death family antitoxin [Opitutaceae bacterium]
MPAAAKSARRPQSRRTSPTVFNIKAVKTHLSKLLDRVERGERITIARAGKPVAVIAPAPVAPQRPPLSPDDPLLNLHKFGFDGPGGKLTTEDIRRDQPRPKESFTTYLRSIPRGGTFEFERRAARPRRDQLD